MQRLERTTFETPRASEYFTLDGLSKQTGRGWAYFPEVVIKELADNALDACEANDVRPEISIKVDKRSITVTDNGPGIPTETVRKILNFNTRTSDKAAYRSPTRGAQGNALKTVLGIPHALGSEEPVEVESQGVRHVIRCWLDPAGDLRQKHDLRSSSRTRGTSVTVPLSARALGYLDPDDLRQWAESFALLNPHADVKIEESEGWSKHACSVPSHHFRRNLQRPHPEADEVPS